MIGFFIYGIRVPREWLTIKEMETGININAIHENIIYYYINTRNGDEVLIGRSLPVSEENKDSRTIIVPELSEKDKWEVESVMVDRFNLDVSTEYNLYYVEDLNRKNLHS